jgi:hypothetical protein
MSNTVTECSDEENASHSQHSDDESVDDSDAEEDILATSLTMKS